MTDLILKIQILYLILLIGNCAVEANKACDVGYTTDDLMGLNLSEESCQLKANHCYQPLGNHGGICYKDFENDTLESTLFEDALPRTSLVQPPSLDNSNCTLRAQVTWESKAGLQQILAMFPDSYDLNTTDPIACLAKCLELNCFAMANIIGTKTCHLLQEPQVLSIKTLDTDPLELQEFVIGFWPKCFLDEELVLNEETTMRTDEEQRDEEKEQEDKQKEQKGEQKEHEDKHEEQKDKPEEQEDELKEKKAKQGEKQEEQEDKLTEQEDKEEDDVEKPDLVKNVPQIEDPCQSYDGPPPHAELKMTYQSVKTLAPQADNQWSCREHCLQAGMDSCTFYTFAPLTSECFLWPGPNMFIDNQEVDSNPPSVHGGAGCVVEPIGGKVVFQDILFIPYSNGKNLANPTLILEFLTGESTLCWFTCEKLPWCLAAGFVQGDCFLYDKEDVIVDSPNNAEGFMVRRGKTFGDESMCEYGKLTPTIMTKDFETIYTSSNRLFGCTKWMCKLDDPIPNSSEKICYLPADEPTTLTKIAGDVFVRPTIEMLNELSSPDFHVPMFPDEVPDVTYSECIVACHNANCFAVTYILETKMCRMAFQPMLLQNDAHLSPEKGVAVNMAMKFGIASSEVMEGTTNSTCVRRVMMQERIVYKDEIQCTHTYQESCSDVYKTVFNTQEVEECKESFSKKCHIEYEMVPRTEKVEVCHAPLARNCKEEGPETCSTEYETVCATTYHENEVTDDVANCTTVKEDVCDPKGENCRKVPKQSCRVESVASKKLTPETDCRQEAREVCGPEICPIVRGERICADELKTFVQEVPQEKCQISPEKVCDMVHKIVPKLEMNQECIEVPQEICEMVKVEAKKEKIPIVKEWCGPIEFAPVIEDATDDSDEYEDCSEEDDDEDPDNINTRSKPSKPSKPSQESDEDPDNISRPSKPGKPSKPSQESDEDPDNISRPSKPGKPSKPSQESDEDPDNISRPSKPGKPSKPSQESKKCRRSKSSKKSAKVKTAKVSQKRRNQEHEMVLRKSLLEELVAAKRLRSREN